MTVQLQSRQFLRTSWDNQKKASQTQFQSWDASFEPNLNSSEQPSPHLFVHVLSTDSLDGRGGTGKWHVCVWSATSVP
jgi:hypothetical protein